MTALINFNSMAKQKRKKVLKICLEKKLKTMEISVKLVKI